MEQKSKKIALVIAAIAGILLIALVVVGVLDEIGSKPADDPNNDEIEEMIDANCTASECMDKIETSDSVEKITEVIGVEPEENDGNYKWVLANKESVSREKSGSSSILQATINKDSIANDDLDFTIFTDLKKELESGESFTYDELVKRLNGVEGTLASKTDNSKRYIWVDKHNQTFSATFSNANGLCSIISLR